MQPKRRLSVAVVLWSVFVMAFAAFLVAAPSAMATHDSVTWTNYGDLAGADHFNRAFGGVLGAGNVLYVPYITQNTNTALANINLTKLTTGGGLFNAPVVLLDRQVNDNPNVVYSARPPTIAMDHAGNIYVAWTRNPSGMLSYDVYVSKSTDGGNSWLPAVRVNQPNNNELDYYPSITTTPEGFIWVSYLQQNGPFSNVTVARSTNGGNTFSLWVNASQQKVPTDGILDSHLASDSLGRLYLVVETYSFSSAFHYVLNYTWSDDGINWSVPTPITSATTWALNAGIAVDAANHIHLAWEDYRTIYSLGVPTVWYTQSTDRGLTWSPQLPLETTAISNNPQYVHLATFGSNVMAVWGSTGAGNGMTYAVSGDGGATWYDAKNAAIGYAVVQPSVSVDENGTFWTVVTDNTGVYRRVGDLAWNSPPTTPANVAVARSGTTGLSVSWSRDPEKDVAAYRVWRSSDGGRSYQLLATLGFTATSYLDSGLVNGTYWYSVTALDLAGTSSHPSFPLSGTVGPTTAEMIAALQAQITALKAQVSDAQANITALQNQLTALQNAQAANDTATRAALANLQGQISSLWNQLNQTRQDLANARAEQATQTMSYVNMALAIIIVLLVAMLLLQMRRPRNPVQVMSPEPPGRVVAQPRTPEEEL
ncbi:MAG: hypothetical protein E6K08_04805 [Methanobacteriota archaeon]|nr:MAG: hypothetical protein E6K08_04805 [Euryarchaeota archaeon]